MSWVRGLYRAAVQANRPIQQALNTPVGQAVKQVGNVLLPQPVQMGLKAWNTGGKHYAKGAVDAARDLKSSAQTYTNQFSDIGSDALYNRAKRKGISSRDAEAVAGILDTPALNAIGGMAKAFRPKQVISDTNMHAHRRFVEDAINGKTGSGLDINTIDL